MSKRRTKLLKQRLTFARESAGLSLTDVATALGVSRQSVWQWESEQIAHRTDPATMVKLARLYGVPVEWLASDEKLPRDMFRLLMLVETMRELDNDTRRFLVDEIERLVSLKTDFTKKRQRKLTRIP